MAYDANGNLVKDLDRDIMTIRYNILNLPELIQFKNGNQIQNQYDAGGRKLKTFYLTWLPGATAPVVNAGDVLTISYSPSTIGLSGTFYVDNFEYDLLGGVGLSLGRIHNAEGYVQNLASPQYYYYRRDHLGNNREVWLANTATTVQRTQYYPSGLPWADGMGASVQNRKYGGKEFVEVHGLDEYDSQARWYYPAILRTTTVDPLAEKYYSISPYAWCKDNPLRLIDPDGRSWRCL